MLDLVVICAFGQGDLNVIVQVVRVVDRHDLEVAVCCCSYSYNDIVIVFGAVCKCI